MLNIYEGALKIINPKLYNSPYKVNVFEVLKIIKNYKFRCRLIYLNNLLTLKIEEVPIEELNDGSLVLGAAYKTKKNKIELANNSELVNIDDNINHELFHTASTRRNINTGVVFEGYGYCLTEGITEYLNLKSKNINASKSGYQLELFVIEFLVFIYGEQILEPYFLNNGKKFFNQFGKIKEDIIYLEESLRFASNNDEYQFYRAFYLCVADIIPEKMPCSESFLKKLELNHSTFRLIKYHLSKVNNKIEEFIKVNGAINPSNYKFKNTFFENMYKEFILEYNQIQRSNFKEVLDILIDIAIKNGKRLEDVNEFVKTLVLFKREDFRILYEDILDNPKRTGKER